MSDATGPTGGDGSFLDRLGELVLLAHASGQAVEGSWYIVIDNPMVPDVHVEIVRLDSTPGSGRRGSSVLGAERPFEAKIESFLLTAFAEGEEITGTWELWYGGGQLPTWRVVIELGAAGADGGLNGYPVGAHDEG